MPPLPSGVILMWSGTIATIPGGYVLCDGNNGTPDLRDRFLRAAGAIYNPGDTGGSTTHTHTFTGDGHSHTFLPGTIMTAGPQVSDQTDVQNASGTTNPASSIPTYYALAYIMKT